MFLNKYSSCFLLFGLCLFTENRNLRCGLSRFSSSGREHSHTTGRSTGKRMDEGVFLRELWVMPNRDSVHIQRDENPEPSKAAWGGHHIEQCSRCGSQRPEPAQRNKKTRQGEQFQEQRILSWPWDHSFYLVALPASWSQSVWGDWVMKDEGGQTWQV